MADERCERTELLTTQCGCPQHRGGQTPQEEADAERLQLRARLLSGGVVSNSTWFPARYAGTCANCGTGFDQSTAIRTLPQGYLAECCAEEVERG